MPSKRKASGRPRGRPPKDDQSAPAGPSNTTAAPKDKRVISFAEDMEHTSTPAGTGPQQSSSTARKERYGKYAESATSTDILQKDTQSRGQASTSNVTSQTRHASHSQYGESYTPERQTHSPPPGAIQGRQTMHQDALRQPTHSPPPAAITFGQGQSSQSHRPPQYPLPQPPAFSNRPFQGQPSQNRPPQYPAPQPPAFPPLGQSRIPQSVGKQAGKKMLRSTQSMSDITGGSSLTAEEAATFDEVNQNTFQREVKRTGEYFAHRLDQAQRDREARKRQAKTFEAIREGEDDDDDDDDDDVFEALASRSNVAKKLRELDEQKKARDAEKARRAKLPPIPPFDTITTSTTTTNTSTTSTTNRY